MTEARTHCVKIRVEMPDKEYIVTDVFIHTDNFNTAMEDVQKAMKSLGAIHTTVFGITLPSLTRH